MSIDPSAFIHPTSIVDNGASIGSNCKIWHWSHICSGAKIRDNTSIGQNVYIASKVCIGKDVKIQNNVSIYDNVILKDKVFCGPSMVFTNVLNPRSSIDRKNEYLDTIVEEGATLGANSTIVCGNKIGKYSFIGAGAVVTKDVIPYALMVGVPARQMGWISEYGEQINLPLKGEGTWICEKTQSKYLLKNNLLFNLSNN